MTGESANVVDAEVVRSPLAINQLVVFRPSKRFLKKYKVPDAHYSALVIGIQKLKKQPILRVFNPYAGQCELPKQQTLPPAMIKAHLGPFELAAPINLPKNHLEDWSVWCDEQNTWGTWE